MYSETEIFFAAVNLGLSDEQCNELLRILRIEQRSNPKWYLKDGYVLPQVGDSVRPRKGFCYDCPTGATITAIKGERAWLDKGNPNEWYILFKLEKQ